jgi:hypothetical protein
MVRTFSLNANIPENREVKICLPTDVPTGPAEIVLVVSSSESSTASTLDEFGDSEFFGMWRDRSDIKNSFEFARDLRSEGWKRSAR